MNHETYSTKIKTWEHYPLSVSMLGSFTWKTTDLLQLWRDCDYHSQCQDNMKQLLIFSEGGGVSWEKSRSFERGADLLGQVQIFCVQMGRCSSSEGGAQCRSSEGGAQCKSSEGGAQCRSSEEGADLMGDSGGGADLLREVQIWRRCSLLREVQTF